MGSSRTRGHDIRTTSTSLHSGTCFSATHAAGCSTASRPSTSLTPTLARASAGMGSEHSRALPTRRDKTTTRHTAKCTSRETTVSQTTRICLISSRATDSAKMITDDESNGCLLESSPILHSHPSSKIAQARAYGCLHAPTATPLPHVRMARMHLVLPVHSRGEASTTNHPTQPSGPSRLVQLLPAPQPAPLLPLPQLAPHQLPDGP